MLGVSLTECPRISISIASICSLRQLPYFCLFVASGIPSLFKGISKALLNNLRFLTRLIRSLITGSVL